jgi:hypothetical protein
MMALRLRVRELLRRNDGGRHRGHGQVGDRESRTGQVAAWPELRAKALARCAQLREGPLDARVVDPEVAVRSSPHPRPGRPRNESPPASELGRERLEHQLGVGLQVMDEEQARVRPELLVEELLELQRPPALIRVGRV